MDKELKESVFTANGNKYYIHKSLTIERYKAYQKMQIEVGFGLGFAGMIAMLQKIYKFVNEQKFADAAVAINNTLTSVSGMDQREDPVLILCALFINREDEDITKIEDNILTEKINDWKVEGIPMDFFLGYAQHLVADYQKILSELEGREVVDLLRNLESLQQSRTK